MPIFLERPRELKRVVLKISGECIRHERGFVVDYQSVTKIATEIFKAKDNTHCQIAVVTGGFIDSALLENAGVSRQSADEVGIISTISASVLLASALARIAGNEKVRIASSPGIRGIAEEYNSHKTSHHLSSRRVVIIAGGTGNPRSSTDYAAVLRAFELSAEMVLKGTLVRGIMDKDPRSHDDPNLIDRLSYKEFLGNDYPLMDPPAVSEAMKENMPIRIFDIFKPGNLLEIIRNQNQDIGSLICS
ncbi:MAG: UMP kinase [bacterium]|nr:UMP kinase [bacterium]